MGTKINNITDEFLSQMTKTIKQELNSKVNTVEGKGLSSNDFTAEYKSKLDNMAVSNGLNIKYYNLFDDMAHDFYTKDNCLIVYDAGDGASHLSEGTVEGEMSITDETFTDNKFMLCDGETVYYYDLTYIKSMSIVFDSLNTEAIEDLRSYIFLSKMNFMAQGPCYKFEKPIQKSYWFTHDTLQSGIEYEIDISTLKKEGYRYLCIPKYQMYDPKNLDDTDFTVKFFESISANIEQISYPYDDHYKRLEIYYYKEGTEYGNYIIPDFNLISYSKQNIADKTPIDVSDKFSMTGGEGATLTAIYNPIADTIHLSIYGNGSYTKKSINITLPNEYKLSYVPENKYIGSSGVCSTSNSYVMAIG